MHLEIRVQADAPADVREWIALEPQRGDLAEAVETFGKELGRLSGDRLQAAKWEVATYFDVQVPSSSPSAQAGSTSLFAGSHSTLDTVARDDLQDAFRVSEEWNDLRPAEMTEWMCLHFCWQLDTALQATLALLSKYISDEG